MDNYHNTKSGDHWQLAKEGASHASKIGPTKEYVLTQAHELLGNKTASLKIHGVDGKVKEERTYPRSSDPRKSPG